MAMSRSLGWKIGGVDRLAISAYVNNCNITGSLGGESFLHIVSLPASGVGRHGVILDNLSTNLLETRSFSLFHK